MKYLSLIAALILQSCAIPSYYPVANSYPSYSNQSPSIYNQAIQQNRDFQQQVEQRSFRRQLNDMNNANQWNNGNNK